MQPMQVGHGASPARFKRRDGRQRRRVVIGAEELLALCKDALDAAGEGEAEICAQVRRRGFARFAIGELGQHMEARRAERGGARRAWRARRRGARRWDRSRRARRRHPARRRGRALRARDRGLRGVRRRARRGASAAALRRVDARRDRR